ncbi:MAG: class I SAM-dependent methyltransferase [Vulcanimicrobiota bacterium]
MKLKPFEKFLLSNRIRYFIQRKFEAPRLFENVILPGNAVCLEVGTGAGVGTLLINKYLDFKKLISIDIDPGMLKTAQNMLKNPPGWAGNVDMTRIELVEKDLLEIADENNTFDAVFLFDVLHHIPEWKEGIGEIYKVLKPGGIFVFEEALISDSWYWFNDFFGHVPFSGDELMKTIEEKGFKIQRFHKPFLFPFCFVKAEK